MMKLQILGSHGSDFLPEEYPRAQAFRSMGILIDETVLLDAGTASSVLTLGKQLQIRCVLLSHYHMDHIKELPALIANRYGRVNEPLVVASIDSILQGLEAYIFNDHIFPNFFSLPTSENPALTAIHLVPGRETNVMGLGVTPIVVNHLVPAVGFIIRDSHSSWVYSGDTGATNEIWETTARLPNVKGVMIEASFPNEFQDLATITKHLTPASLAKEFEKIGRDDLPVYAFHLKPQYHDQIVSQLDDLRLPKLTVLQEGQEISFT